MCNRILSLIYLIEAASNTTQCHRTWQKTSIVFFFLFFHLYINVAHFVLKVIEGHRSNISWISTICGLEAWMWLVPPTGRNAELQICQCVGTVLLLNKFKLREYGSSSRRLYIKQVISLDSSRNLKKWKVHEKSHTLTLPFYSIF